MLLASPPLLGEEPELPDELGVELEDVPDVLAEDDAPLLDGDEEEDENEDDEPPAEEASL